jgi:hypothetical protein
MGLATSATANCLLVVGSDYIGCTIQGGPAAVQGEIIKLTRATTGQWTCGTNVIQKLVGPSGVCLYNATAPTI